MNCLQGEFPFCHSSESHCQTIKSQHNTLKHFYNDRKIAISSSSSFCSKKIWVKEYFNQSHFPLVIKSRVFKQKDWYTCAVKMSYFNFFFTLDKRANIMTVSRLERKSLWRCTKFEWNVTDSQWYILRIMTT